MIMMGVCWPGPPTTSSSFGSVAKVCCCAVTVLLVVFVIDPCCLRGLTGVDLLFCSSTSSTSLVTAWSLLDELIPTPFCIGYRPYTGRSGCTFLWYPWCLVVAFFSLGPSVCGPGALHSGRDEGFFRASGVVFLCLQSTVVPFCCRPRHLSCVLVLVATAPQPDAG